MFAPADIEILADSWMVARTRSDPPCVLAGTDGPTIYDCIPASPTGTARATSPHKPAPHANICEQCDNYTTSTEFLPQIEAQMHDETELRDDALERGWDSEVARHARVITSLQRHLDRLKA